MNKELIERNFTYHAPRDNDIPKMASVRSHCKVLALLIDSYMPDSREKSLALTALEEVSMWTNAGIVRNEEQVIMLGGPEGTKFVDGVRQIIPSTMSLESELVASMEFPANPLPDNSNGGPVLSDRTRAAIEEIKAIVAAHAPLATPKAGKCGRDGGCGSCSCNA